MADERPKLTAKWLLLSPGRRGPGRPLCALVGIIGAALLHKSGFLAAEPTMMSGIAFAALGAIAGLLAYGIFDFVRRLRAANQPPTGPER